MKRRIRVGVFGALSVAALGAPIGILAQQGQGDRSAVPAGERYRARWLHRLFLGTGYRPLWVHPIEVPEGVSPSLVPGLRPLRLGGGTTSTTLHVEGPDGTRYVFRSVDKNPNTGELATLQKTIVGVALQDQISSFHPSAALAVAALLDRTDILHVTPRLVRMPPSSELVFHEDLPPGTLVWFEERPSGPGVSRAAFAESDAVVATDELLDSVRASSLHRVDERAFLKARIFDLLVGDRDRAVDNWRWAGYRQGDGWRWVPIPRDRDQAFVHMDGLVKGVLRMWEPRLVTFGDAIDVRGLTRNAWDLDRRFLSGAPGPVWDSVVEELQAEIDDEAIDDAVRSLPAEYPDAHRRRLARVLRVRRGRLREAAREFSRLVSDEAVVFGTDQADSIHATRVDSSLVVELWSPEADAPYYRQSFHSVTTGEVRLYGAGGRDVLGIDGDGTSEIRVWLLGGAGRDRLTDATSGTRVGLVDSGDETVFVASPRTRIVRDSPPQPKYWAPEQTPRDFGHRTVPAVRADANSDFGVSLGLGFTRQSYDLLSVPYATQFTILAGVALQRGRGYVRAEMQRVPREARAQLQVGASYSGIERLRFHGFGNDSETGGPAAFYRIPHDEYEVSAQLRSNRRSGLRFAAGPVFKMTRTDTAAATGTLLSNERPYGSGSFWQTGVRATVERCQAARRRIRAPWASLLPCRSPTFESDVSFIARGQGLRGSGGKRAGWFTTGAAEVSVKVGLGAHALVATRAGGRLASGRAPFFEHAFLGGSSTLRGFSFDRFVGDRSLFGSVELRVKVLDIETGWFPLEVGTVASGEAGRVWYDGQSPGGWHASIGGGLWLAPLHRDFTMRLIAMRSHEGTSVHFGPGFSF